MFKITCLILLFFTSLAHTNALKAQSNEVLIEKIKTLATKCGSEISWIQDWQTASDQAQKLKRPIVILFGAAPPKGTADYVVAGRIMNRDVIQLINTSFVPLRFDKSKAAPFRGADAYGMGKFAFGTSVLVSTAHGTVTGETFTLESTTLFEFLVGQLRENKVAVTAPKELPQEEAVVWLSDRGEDEQARQLIGEPQAPEDYLALVRMLERQRKGSEALAVLKSASADGVAADRLAMSKARVLIRLGRLTEAWRALQGIPKGHKDSFQKRYWEARILFEQGKADLANQVAAQLVADDGASRWSWAASYLMVQIPYLKKSGQRTLSWPSSETVALTKVQPFAKTTVANLHSAKWEAVSHLLKTQRQDGSWPNGFEVMAHVDTHRFQLSVATTALATRSLLPFRKQKHVAAAIDRAMKFLAKSCEHSREHGDLPTSFDYAVWAKPCLLSLFSHGIKAGLVSLDDWRDTIDAIVKDMGALQKRDGGWTYVPGDPGMSISFVTAFNLIALDEAKKEGIKIPSVLSKRAVRCLEKCRMKSGVFTYFAFPNEKSVPKRSDSGKAGRGALCALALFKWRKATPSDMEKALDQFLKYRAIYAQEHGKTVMHCGPDGEGSHYLLFDYAYAAAACACLPKEKQLPYRAAIIDQIRGARSVSGAYVDNPIMTDRYGTALALWGFQMLTQQ